MRRKTALASVIAGLLIAPVLATPAAASNPVRDTATPGQWTAYPLANYTGQPSDMLHTTFCTRIPHQPFGSARNGADSGYTLYLYSDSNCLIPTGIVPPGHGMPFTNASHFRSEPAN